MLTKIIKKLDEIGYIEIVGDEKDRRIRHPADHRLQLRHRKLRPHQGGVLEGRAGDPLHLGLRVPVLPALPRQIISIFGGGDELYFEFAVRYFRIYLFCIFIVGLQLLCAQFFPSIGKGGIGVFVSLLRRAFLLLPLVLIFPLIWGIDGVLWAGPVADGLAGIISLLLVRHEMNRWTCSPK